MKRRPTRSSLPPAAGSADASGLSTCVACRRDYVVPVEWETVGTDRWWMFLRCAQCGVSREVTVADAVAQRYDTELRLSAEAIRRAAEQLEQERMAAEADVFVDALRRGLIEPADFRP